MKYTGAMLGVISQRFSWVLLLATASVDSSCFCSFMASKIDFFSADAVLVFSISAIAETLLGLATTGLVTVSLFSLTTGGFFGFTTARVKFFVGTTRSFLIVPLATALSWFVKPIICFFGVLLSFSFTCGVIVLFCASLFVEVMPDLYSGKRISSVLLIFGTVLLSLFTSSCCSTILLLCVSPKEPAK